MSVLYTYRKEKTRRANMKFKIETLESYTVMPNKHLRDKNLSLKAKGLLCTMYCLPNEWDYSMNGLVKITNTGITAIRSTIAELEINGYITRQQQRNEKGQYEYIYIVHINKKRVAPTKNCTSLRRFQNYLKKH